VDEPLDFLATKHCQNWFAFRPLRFAATPRDLYPAKLGSFCKISLPFNCRYFLPRANAAFRRDSTGYWLLCFVDFVRRLVNVHPAENGSVFSSALARPSKPPTGNPKLGSYENTLPALFRTAHECPRSVCIRVHPWPAFSFPWTNGPLPAGDHRSWLFRFVKARICRLLARAFAPKPDPQPRHHPAIVTPSSNPGIMERGETVRMRNVSPGHSSKYKTYD
jgi:hypothetical protein